MPRSAAVAWIVAGATAAGVIGPLACVVSIDDSLVERAGADASSDVAISPDASRGDAADAPPSPSCPAAMIAIPYDDAGVAFCVDATEVTVAAYDAYLKTNPSAPGSLAACAWNTSYVPDGWMPQTTPGGMPVVGVDWCDAHDYCLALGKTLCGSIPAGGPVEYDQGVYDAGASQWYRACSHAGAHPYPYGDAYDAQACVGHDYAPTPSAPRLAGQTPTCEGGYPGLFDMVGNVQEWLDSCQTPPSPVAGCNSGGPDCDLCRSGGGGFGNTASFQKCNGGDQLLRSAHYSDTGFRCCASPG